MLVHTDHRLVPQMKGSAVLPKKEIDYKLKSNEDLEYLWRSSISRLIEVVIQGLSVGCGPDFINSTGHFRREISDQFTTEGSTPNRQTSY